MENKVAYWYAHAHKQQQAAAESKYGRKVKLW